MKWDYKLNLYRNYFESTYGLVNLQFSENIDKLLVRNESLRAGRRELYLSFLRDHYPQDIGLEIAQYDRIVSSLFLVDRHRAQQIFDRLQIRLLQSDIWIEDEDTIFRALKMDERDVLHQLDRTLTEWVTVNVLPQETLGYPYIWLDLSQFSEELIASDVYYSILQSAS
ncbi:hypothetical protein [Sphingobacterium suaedae]|uniref:DUF2004 domain-containing protein n=1 Tax=Sphingobacterium suaedae TaxID=1686402 RepID=A0ABW5KQ08_9SPHI